MKNLLVSAGVAAAILGVGTINAPAQAFSVVLSGGGDTADENIKASIGLADLGDNLRFVVSLLPEDTTGNIGDLRGFFFDIIQDDQAFLDSLSIVNASQSISNVTFKKDNVINLGQDNNLNGRTSKKFDAGFSIGQQGIGGGDDIRSITFELASSSGALNLGLFNKSTRAGVRAQSVGPEGTSREGSAKLVGEVPTPALLPGLVGMAIAALRNKKEEDVEETA